MTDPWLVIAAAAVLTGLTAAAGVALQRLACRLPSLRTQVLVIALAALAIGVLAAVSLGRLMVLGSEALGAVLAVLALIVPFVIALVVVATAPLRQAASRIETTLSRLEEGDHSARVNMARSDEFGRVARSLDRLGRQLETLEVQRAEIDRDRQRMDVERRYLISSISHDLRTPIGALRAAVEALRDGIAPDPERYLTSMNHDLVALSALVDDLFLLSQMEAGLLAIEPELVDLAELADETAEALGPVADTRGIALRLRSAEAVPVWGNAAALGRVLRNLVDNAIRHSPNGSAVQIEVRPGNPSVVRVIDSGPGFPADFKDHAFDRFARADPSRSRAHGGAGLGLAIAKGLVEAHRGAIRIEGPPGGQVVVELPGCLPAGPTKDSA
ncbi:MAG: HAMP domain-containing histidine kinase [Acidimicrobiia bacterium]|nr:HAMP domain-containing histidine kinase [Acidimicrobiia bacterium]